MPIVTEHYDYTEHQVARKGRIDGKPWKWRLWPFVKAPKPSFPAADYSSHAPYEVELTQSAEAALGIVAGDWHKEDVELRTAYARALTHQQHARQALRKESAESEATAREFDAVRSKYLAFEVPLMSVGAATILLFVFGASEAVFNGMVFQIFGERLVFTWALAAGIGVVFPFLGHAVGSLLKLTMKRSMDWVQIAGTFVTAVVALVGVSAMRGIFLERGHVRELLGLSMTPATARAIFFVFNLVLFFAAVLVGYLSGHVDGPLFKTVKKQYQSALRGREKEGGEAAAAARDLAAADQEVAETRQRRAKRFRVAQQTAMFIKEKNDWLISVYREANQTARAGSPTPVCFTLPIMVAKVPDVFLSELEWPSEAESPAQAQTVPSEVRV